MTNNIMALADAYATQMIHAHYHPMKEARAALLEEVDRVTAERDALLVRLQEVMNTFANEIDTFRAERDALRADAERYRWLREQDDSSPLFCMYGSNGPWGECGHSEIYGELLDTSIDKEMKGKS